MPGGSGLIDQIVGRFPEVLAAARAIVEECPAACMAACIDCLQTFRNGFYHKYLDRTVAAECFTDWGGVLRPAHDIPQRQPAQAGSSTGALPVNLAETRLRELLLAAGFADGLRGEQLRLDPAVGTTTPDVIYRAAHHDDDEGVCIYLDGLSEHLHGDPATAAKDRQIRDYLRAHGYEVIEIAASDLGDQGAMVRHFRKLAGYLDEPALRDGVRADQSWFEQVGSAAVRAAQAALRVVRPEADDRHRTCVPLVPLQAAAGAFGDPQQPSLEEREWVEVPGRSLREGMFVAQVVGRSMEPSIPDGSYCLFLAPVAGSRQGKIVLAELRDGLDSETGERYSVKRYTSVKAETEDGWRHVAVTLEPVNRDFAPIELVADEESDVHVVAEFVAVLGDRLTSSD
jgi:SOS-response transcriptional repressor LexA